MIDYGLKGRVALITGINNPQGIGAATALAFAREGTKLVLVYKKIDRPFDKDKTGNNGADRYYAANAGDADHLERSLLEMDAEYLILKRDISDEDAVKDIYKAAVDRFGRVDILVNNAAVDDENGLDTIEMPNVFIPLTTFCDSRTETALSAVPWAIQRGSSPSPR